jgi:hypothetical protein
MEMLVFTSAIGFLRAFAAAYSHCETNNARKDPGRQVEPGPAARGRRESAEDGQRTGSVDEISLPVFGRLLGFRLSRVLHSLQWC